MPCLSTKNSKLSLYFTQVHQKRTIAELFAWFDNPLFNLQHVCETFGCLGINWPSSQYQSLNWYFCCPCPSLYEHTIYLLRKTCSKTVMHQSRRLDKSVTVWCQCGPIPLRNISNNLVTICHKEIRQFWRPKGDLHLFTWRGCQIKSATSCMISSKRAHAIIFRKTKKVK